MSQGGSVSTEVGLRQLDPALSDAPTTKALRDRARKISAASVQSSLFDSKELKERYAAFSRLQAAAVAFQENLPIPEIVAIGGQSDGKSSLLEAMLGFRFNVREVEMGTRRPLILQMVHEPTALEPRCFLQEEDSEEYGPAIEPATAVAEAIHQRTASHLKALGGNVAVSSKPIVIRAEYAHSANLTIIDTPGFILKAKKGEPPSTPEDILAMVQALATPPHRLLLFLQQSSVEWCSSLWLDVVKAIDPTLRRTIIVASKFDNRLKEFAERTEVDRYLSASGFLGEGTRPFFVALPKERASCSNEDFREQICAVDARTLRHLREEVAGGFDESQFGDRVGFANLRYFLEGELQKRYRAAAPATLALLERRSAEVTDELAQAEGKLAVITDVAALRRMAMAYAAAISGHVVALINGAADPDPAEFGSTSAEERVQSGLEGWPGIACAGLMVPNGGLRLYGGAAFERVLGEFRAAACCLDCPPVSHEKVANILLGHAVRHGGGVAAAASEISHALAKAWLGPILERACDRLAHTLISLYDVAAERLRCHPPDRRVSDSVEAYVGFRAALRRVYEQFVRQLAADCKELARHHLTTAASPFFFPYGLQLPEAGSRINWEHGGPLPGDGRGSSEINDCQESRFHEDLENVAPLGSGTPTAARGVARSNDGEPLHESQLTVPETPSPEQGISKRPPRKGLLKSLHHERPPSKALHRRNCPSGIEASSTYDAVRQAVTEHFRVIRSVLVDQLVPSALSDAFLRPCQERMPTAVALELFACSDEAFMAMFMSRGALEALQNERREIQKRHSSLHACLQEFRTMSLSL